MQGFRQLEQEIEGVQFKDGIELTNVERLGGCLMTGIQSHTTINYILSNAGTYLFDAHDQSG